jgi:hypothetical protein
MRTHSSGRPRSCDLDGKISLEPVRKGGAHDHSSTRAAPRSLGCRMPEGSRSLAAHGPEYTDLCACSSSVWYLASLISSFGADLSLLAPSGHANCASDSGRALSGELGILGLSRIYAAIGRSCYDISHRASSVVQRIMSTGKAAGQRRC